MFFSVRWERPREGEAFWRQVGWNSSERDRRELEEQEWCSISSCLSILFINSAFVFFMLIILFTLSRAILSPSIFFKSVVEKRESVPLKSTNNLYRISYGSNTIFSKRRKVLPMITLNVLAHELKNRAQTLTKFVPVDHETFPRSEFFFCFSRDILLYLKTIWLLFFSSFLCHVINVMYSNVWRSSM